MKCPRCKNEAKQSSSYADLYVCDCLGYLEDVIIIAKKYGGVDTGGTLQILEIKSVDELLEVGNALDNAAGSLSHAQDYFSRGKLYRVLKGTQLLYLVFTTKNKLIPGGAFFGKMKNNAPNSDDRKKFQEVTKTMIAKGLLQPSIFSPVDDRATDWLKKQ